MSRRTTGGSEAVTQQKSDEGRGYRTQLLSCPGTRHSAHSARSSLHHTDALRPLTLLTPRGDPPPSLTDPSLALHPPSTHIRTGMGMRRSWLTMAVLTYTSAMAAPRDRNPPAVPTAAAAAAAESETEAAAG